MHASRMHACTSAHGVRVAPGVCGVRRAACGVRCGVRGACSSCRTIAGASVEARSASPTGDHATPVIQPGCMAYLATGTWQVACRLPLCTPAFCMGAFVHGCKRKCARALLPSTCWRPVTWWKGVRFGCRFGFCGFGPVIGSEEHSARVGWFSRIHRGGALRRSSCGVVCVAHPPTACP